MGHKPPALAPVLPCQQLTILCCVQPPSVTTLLRVSRALLHHPGLFVTLSFLSGSISGAGANCLYASCLVQACHLAASTSFAAIACTSLGQHSPSLTVSPCLVRNSSNLGQDHPALLQDIKVAPAGPSPCPMSVSRPWPSSGSPRPSSSMLSAPCPPTGLLPRPRWVLL